MSATAIRVFGICTFAFGALVVFGSIGPREWSFGPPPKARLIAGLVFMIVTTMVGVGLLLLRKWAALLFSLALVGFPIWIGIDWFGEVPIGVYAMLLAVVLVLVLPIIIIVRSWRLLSWRGKSFL